MKQINIKDPKKLLELMQKPTVELAEVVTGFISGGVPEQLAFAGRIVQATLKWSFLEQLGREWRRLEKESKIKEDPFSGGKNKATFIEFLKYLEQDAPDEDVFDAMKHIFFKAIDVDSTEIDEIRAFEYLKICKRLQSGEILTLKACYELSKKSDYDHTAVRSAQKWLNEIAQYLSLNAGLINNYEKNLLELSLISERLHPDKSGVNSPNMRLTDLGLDFVEFISQVE